MEFTWVFGTACVLFVFLIAVRAVLSHYKRLKPPRTGTNPNYARKPAPGADAGRVRQIDAAELRRLSALEPELTVFHLSDRHTPSETRAARLPGELIVTWSQLEEALRWAPHGARIVIYRAEGVDQSQTRRLAAYAHTHEVLLLCGSAPEMENG